MIEKISVTNFKCHAHTEIELGRVTALVGPNGSGKTSLLQAIQCISSLSSENKPSSKILVDEIHPDILVRGHGNSFSFKLRGRKADVGWQIVVNLLTETSYAGQFRSWLIQPQGFWGNKHFDPSPRNFAETIRGLIPNELPTEICPVEYFKASPKKLSEPSSLETVPPVLSFDGSGLSSVIANLILSDPDRHRVIEEELCKLVPTVRKVRAKQTHVKEKEIVHSIGETGFPISTERVNRKPGYELVFDTLSSQAVPAHAMSEGTMLALGMLTLLYRPYPPIMFLIDDVEYGLHPLAQRKMMSILKRFAESQECQIVLTSHSPYIVDELEAKDIWVMATDQEGISHCKRLSDHPDIEYALSVLTTGEVWGAEGEEWVLNGSLPTETANA